MPRIAALGFIVRLLTFQMAKVAVQRELFAAMLERGNRWKRRLAWAPAGRRGQEEQGLSWATALRGCARPGPRRMS